MRDRWTGILVCTVFVTAGAIAQQQNGVRDTKQQPNGARDTNPVVRTSGGTTGTIPMFDSSSTIGDSVITQTGNQVGIGTTNNTALNPLLVLSLPAGGGIGMSGLVDPTQNNYSFAESDYWLTNPAVSSAPNAFLWAFGAEGTYSDSGQVTSEDAYIYDPNTGVYNFAVDQSDNVYIGGMGFGFGTNPDFYAGINGNVGIGTSSPGTTLEVNGSVTLTKGSNASITFADGTLQKTAYTGVMQGGDYAESVDVTGDRTRYQPGDVLVIDPSSPGRFLKSSQPYSTSVTGIFSTKPGTVGRRQTTPQTADEVPMAMMGIVPTNVTAENGAIRPGDLLVTSSISGFAMKGTDRARMLGAVIGKAIGSLDSGKGVIEVIVALQ